MTVFLTVLAFLEDAGVARTLLSIMVEAGVGAAVADSSMDVQCAVVVLQSVMYVTLMIMSFAERYTKS